MLLGTIRHIACLLNCMFCDFPKFLHTFRVTVLRAKRQNKAADVPSATELIYGTRAILNVWLYNSDDFVTEMSKYYNRRHPHAYIIGDLNRATNNGHIPTLLI